MNSFSRLFHKLKISANRLNDSVNLNIAKLSSEIKVSRFHPRSTVLAKSPQPKPSQSPPRTLSIMATEQCNLRCLYCLRDTKDNGKEIPWPILKRIILSAYRFGITAFNVTGGEILTYSHWRDLVELIGLLKSSLFVETNGYNLTEEDVIFLKNTLHGRITKILVSLDSDKAEIHDRFRGKGSFDGAVRAIRLLRKHGIPVEINTLITPFNLMSEEEILDYIKFGKQLGVSEIVFGGVVALGRAKNSQFLLNESQRKQISRILVKREFFKDEQGFKFRAGPFLPSAAIQPCYRLGREISVSPYGLHPCVFHVDTIKIGDFRDFEKLLYSKFLDSFFHSGVAAQQCFKKGRFFTCPECVKCLPEWLSVVSKSVSLNPKQSYEKN